MPALRSIMLTVSLPLLRTYAVEPFGVIAIDTGLLKVVPRSTTVVTA